MTLSDRIRGFAHDVPPSVVAASLGCSRQFVASVRWQDRNRECVRARHRQHYKRAARFRGEAGPWHKSQVATLKRLWPKATLAASDIALILNKSRNAVIGKARRLGLPAKASFSSGTSDAYVSPASAPVVSEGVAS